MRVREMRKPRLHNLSLVLCGVLLIALCCGACSAGKPNDAADTKAKASSTAKSESGDLDFLGTYDVNAGQEEPVKQESVFLTAVKFIFKLALVLGLCYGTILLLKKFSGMKPNFGCGGQRIRLIENSSLGSNRTLHLVEVGSKKLLVASTPNHVSLVAEVEIDDTQEPAPVQHPASFKDQLSTFIGNKPDATASARTVAEMLRDSSSFFQDKVREVSGFRGRFRRTGNE